MRIMEQSVVDLMNGFEGVFVSGDYGESNVTFDSANANLVVHCVSPRMHRSGPMP